MSDTLLTTMKEFRKKRLAKLPPIERLGEEVRSQILQIIIREDLIKDKKYPKTWLKGHELSSLPLWGYYAKEEKDPNVLNNASLISRLAHDLPKALIEAGDKKTLQLLHNALPTEWDAPVEVRLDKPVVFTSHRWTVCGVCSEPYKVSFDGKEFTILNECIFPAGIVVEMDIPFPSGKVVVENDVRGLFPEAHKDRDVNQLMENALVEKDYAQAGCALFYVGNCCPGIYQLGKDRLAVGNPGKDRKTLTIDGHRYRNITGICTDLWWYSITDYDEWVRRANVKPLQTNVIPIQPGLYRFTHLRHTYQSLVDYDAYDERQGLYTKIRRIGAVGEVNPTYKIFPSHYNVE